MSDEKPAEPEEGVPAASPHGILHLLPTAPQELIVEVYWHLVGQLQAEGKERPEVRRALDDLNEAYRALMTRPDQDESESPAEAIRSTHEAASHSRRAWPMRYFRRPQPENLRHQGSPWELLHLDPGAPPGVVELAFGFWRQRLRTTTGDSTAPELEELEQAHGLLQSTQSAEPPDSDGDGATTETPAFEADERNQEQASASALRRARQAVAGMLASLRPRPETVRPAVSEEHPAAANAGSIEELGASHSSEPAVSEGNQSSGPVGEEPVHPPAEDTVMADAVPEFLSRETPSRESGPAPDAEVLFAESEAGEQKGADDGSDEAAVEATLGDPAPTPSAESTRAAPSPSSETGDERSPAQGGTWLQAQALLIPESGSVPRREIAIRQEPISLGTAPTCDVVFTAPNSRERQVEARIWRQHGRFMFHNIRGTPSVLVNGQAIMWVVLEHGDRLQVGENVFRFHLSQDGASC